ncbi:MAG: YkgJ family cysteine cluster protein [Actinomycetota bacterium]|nr:YkgJ family cysteine cluster protein [Actinomycetota bacterium]
MVPPPIESLAELYSGIPPVPCRGECVESCGPISMTRQEEATILARGVRIPPMSESMAALERGEDYYCPALRDRQCTVYEDRPTICRLWGATESMRCPHGCTPEGALTQAESHRLLRMAADLGGGMIDDFT